MTQPIELYLANTPNGQKIAILCEEAKIPYVAHFVSLGKGEQFAPEFLAISPNNKIPAIVDPEGPGGAPVSVFESGAILRYLGEKFDAFYPREPRARLECEQWLFWQMAGLGPMSGQAHHFLHAKEQLPYAITRYRDEVLRLYGVLERRLQVVPFVAGAYSIADIAMYPWIVPHKVLVGTDLSRWPALQRWFAAIGARPGVIAGMDVASRRS